MNIKLDYKIFLIAQVVFIYIMSTFNTSLLFNLSIQGVIFYLGYKYIQGLKISFYEEKELNFKKLEQSAKMVALGEISAGIAHEINNPVAIVYGKSQILQMQIEQAKENNTVLDISKIEKINQEIISTTERIDKIINSLRYFVRNDSRNPLVWAGVEEILDNIQVLSIDRCKKNGVNVKINKKIDTGTKIYCKPTQISQVLINLINNSFDAIKDSQEEKWIEISCFENNDNIIFEVQDSGNGITKEAEDKILNSFYTSKNTTKSSGLGIGLTIAKRIIDQHLGTITYLKDRPHTTFEVVLPKGKES